MPGLMCSEAGISGCMAEVVDDGAGEAERDQCLDGVYCLFFGIGLAEEAEFGAASGKRSRLHRPHAYFEVLQGTPFFRDRTTVLVRCAWLVGPSVAELLLS